MTIRTNLANEINQHERQQRVQADNVSRRISFGLKCGVEQRCVGP